MMRNLRALATASAVERVGFSFPATMCCAVASGIPAICRSLYAVIPSALAFAASCATMVLGFMVRMIYRNSGTLLPFTWYTTIMVEYHNSGICYSYERTRRITDKMH